MSELTYDEKKMYGNDVRVEHIDQDCTIYTIENETGYVKMTSYEVFPGICIVYNDVHMLECHLDIKIPCNILEINHCREGRIECQFNNGEYLYISSSDLAINHKKAENHDSYFPLGIYHGISITIDLEKTPAFLSCIFDDVSVDLSQLVQKLCGNANYTVAREKECFSHIFSELYSVPESIKKGYFRIKVLEILLFLSGVEWQDESKIHPYFSQSQTNTVKCIRRFLIEHLDEHITIEEIASQFHISLTGLKTCFKGVYGEPIYTYIRHYKIQYAATKLKNSNESILQIAQSIGYQNASKFARAFCAEVGMAPREYRFYIRQEI